MNGYDYERPSGGNIHVYPNKDGDGAVIAVSHSGVGSLTHILPADVPQAAAGIVAALYEAIGQPAPFIMERLELQGEYSRVQAIDSALIDVSHSPGRVHIDNAPNSGCHVISAAGAREFAAVLLARADAAGQPSLGEIEALAHVIDGWRGEHYDTANMHVSRQLAEHVLAAGYTPPGGGA